MVGSDGQRLLRRRSKLCLELGSSVLMLHSFNFVHQVKD